MPRALVPAIAIALAVALLTTGRPAASADELISNGGFETGLGGWTAIDGELSLTSEAHSGSQAARLSAASPVDALLFQTIPAAAGESYGVSAWIAADPQTVNRSYVRLRWLKAQGFGGFHDSNWAPAANPGGYELVSTGMHTAPPGTISVRVEIAASGLTTPFEVLVDDVSLQGPAPATPSPTQTPTATLSPPPTPTPTQPVVTPPTVTTTPPTPQATPTPTPTPSPTPTPVPIIGLPPAPPPSPTHSAPTRTPRTPTATPSPPPSPTPTPGPIPGTPTVFSELVNGSFEVDGPDGPYGWRKIGGTIAAAGPPVRSGSRALELRSATASTKWAYQTVRVQGGTHYRASAYGRFTDANVEALFLRISWYTSEDGSGQAMSSADSALLDTPSGGFRLLDTGAVAAPQGARSAKVRLMLRPASGTDAAARYDDVEFAPTSPPPPTPTPTATEAPPPGATTNATSTPAPAEEPDPPAEPDVFSRLTNSGFEDVREDGTPYGWRKVGGEVAATDLAQAEGDLSLQFVSSTASTKWAYQTIAVEPGGWYEFDGFAAPGTGTPEVFLRVSWYESEDGGGQAISSDDSPPANAGAAFQYLSTGAIQAPVEARSAKARLMLRPASAARTIAYFDALTFERAAAPAATGDSGRGQEGTTPLTAEEAPADTRSTDEASEVLGVRTTPIEVANAGPAPEATPSVTRDADEGNDDTLIWLLGALAVPVAGFAVIGAIELRRLRDRETD